MDKDLCYITCRMSILRDLIYTITTAAEDIPVGDGTASKAISRLSSLIFVLEDFANGIAKDIDEVAQNLKA